MASEIFKLIGELGMTGADKSVKEMQKVDTAAKKTKSTLEDIDGTRVSATANLDDQASSKVGRIQGLLNRFGGQRYEATAGVKTDEGGLSRINQSLSRFGATRVEATAGVRADEGGLSSLLNSLNIFGQKRVNATAGVTANGSQLTTLQGQLSLFDGKRYTATADLDTGAATTKATAFSTLMNTLIRPIRTYVDVDTGAAMAKLAAFSAMATTVGGAVGAMNTGVASSGVVFTSIAIAIGLAAAALVPLLGAVATLGALGAAAAGGMGLIAGASYVMAQGLYDGGAAIDALTAKWSSMGSQMATALGPASVQIGAFALQVLGIAEQYIPLLGTTTSSVVSGMVANLGELLSWFEQGNQGFTMMSTIIAGISPIMADLSMVAGSLMIGLTGVFSAAIPYAIQLADYIGNIAEQFAGWATSAEGQAQITAAIESAIPVFQALWDMVLQVGAALLNFSTQNAPAIAGAIGIIADIISGAIDAFSWLSGVVGPTGLAIAALTPIFLALVVVIGTIASAVMGVVGVLGAIGAVVGASAAVIGIAIAAVVAGLALLAAGVYTIYTNWGGITAFFTNLWTQITTAFSTGISAVTTTISGWVATVGSYFSGIGTSIMTALQTAWASVTAAFAQLGAIIIPIVTTIVTGIVTAFQGLLTGIMTVITAVTTFFVTAFTTLWSILGPILLIGIALIIGIFYYLFTGIQTVLTTISTAIITFFTMLWTLVSPIVMAGITAFLALWQMLVTGMQLIWTTIQTAAMLFWTTLSALLTPVITLFITTVTTIFNTLVTALQLIWTTIQTAAVTFWNGLVAILTPVIQGFITAVTTIFQGLQTALDVVWTAIQTAATAVWTTIQSTVQPIIQAIADFITTTWTTVQSTTETVWTAIQTAIETAWNYINDTVITPILTAIADFLTTTWTAIQTEVETIWTAIQTAIETVWTYIRDSIIMPILNEIIEFLTTSWTTIQEAATTAWEAISTLISDTWETIKTTVTEAVTALTEAVQSGWDAMVEGATSFGSAFLDAITTGFQEAVNKGLDIIATLLEAAGEGLSSLGGVGEEIGGTLTSAAGTVRGYMFADGGVVGFANGGGSGGMGTQANAPRMHLWNEQVGPEAYIAKNGPKNDQINYLSTAASWFGMGLAPFKRGGGAGFHDGHAGMRISGNTYVEGRRPSMFCNGGVHGARCSCDGSLQFACGGMNTRNGRTAGGMPVVPNQTGNLLGWDCLSNGVLGYTNYSSVDVDSAAGSWNSAGANIQSGGGVSVVDADLGGSYGGLTHPDCTIELDTWSTAQGYGWHIAAHELAHAFGQDHNALDSILNTGQMYSMSGLGGDDPTLAGEIFGVANTEGAMGWAQPTGGGGSTGGTPGGTGTGGTGGSNSQVNTQMTKSITDVQNTGKATGQGARINVGGSGGGGGGGGGNITQSHRVGAPPPAPGANELREWVKQGEDQDNFSKVGSLKTFQLGGTHWGYSPEAQQSMNTAMAACGNCGVPNTYYGHSYRAGCPEENNIDFWGSGGRGSPIDHSCGDCLNNAALADPNITYTIWDGYLSDVGFWGDHYDHVHAAFCGGGGGNGVVCKALRAMAQTALDAAQAVAQTAVGALGAPQPVQGGMDWIMSDGWDAIEAWILEQMPVCGGSGAGECTSQLPTAIKQLGLEGQGYESSMPGLIMGESTDNPNAVNPASGATGCAQTMPDTFDAYKVSDCTDITDPLCNLMASMNYQEQNYGGPVDWTPAGYRTGGAIPNDGLLMAHGGERVLTAAQNRAFEGLIYDTLPRLGMDDTGGGDANVTVVNNINNPQIGTNISLDEFKREMEETGYKSAVRVMKDVQDRRKGHSHRLARRQS